MLSSSLTSSGFDLNGAGGAALSGDGNGGVFLSQSTLVATGPSPSQVRGSASAGQDLNYGVIIGPVAGVETRLATAGDLLIRGSGSGASLGDFNIGVYIGENASVIVDNPRAGQFSDLSIGGLSGTGNDSNWGFLTLGATLQADGATLIEGVSQGSGSGNDGVVIVNASIGVGESLAISGTAGTGENQTGVNIQGANIQGDGNTTASIGGKGAACRMFL